MSSPTVTCQLCGRSRIVTPDGRGFPPDIAKRKLRRECTANGCPCEPKYLAGIDPRLERLIGPEAPMPGDVVRHMGVRRDGDVTVYGEYLGDTTTYREGGAA